MVDELLNEQRIIGIRCQDIQTGLHGYRVNEFETLLEVGMLARLSVHIRGGDVVSYDKLKEVSPTLFDISKLEFPTIIRTAEELDFVEVVGQGASRIIIPKVPYFDDLYYTLGEKAKLNGLNEYEQASIEILQRLAGSPLRKDTIEQSLGIKRRPLDRVVRIGEAGSYFHEIWRPDGDIILSPLYFGENPEFFADAVKKYGEQSIGKTLQLIRRYPGSPFQKVIDENTIGSKPLDVDEVELVKALVSRGIVQSPAIETTYSGKNYFLFTPPVGTSKILVVEKEIYEKAMVFISCVRQGEHFGDWRIKYPSAIIRVLLRDGWLRKTTVAKEQYKALVIKRICRLEPPDEKWQRTVLIDTPENRRALELAAEMLEKCEIELRRGFDSTARETIYSDLQYEEHLRAHSDIRRRNVVPQTRAEIMESTDQLLENIMKGV